MNLEDLNFLFDKDLQCDRIGLYRTAIGVGNDLINSH